MEERLLYCYDCRTRFVFTIDEQKLFQKKGWEAPCRCPACRRAKRERNKDPYYGWQNTMGGPIPAKRGHRRVHYSGLIIAGGLHN